MLKNTIFYQTFWNVILCLIILGILVIVFFRKKKRNDLLLKIPSVLNLRFYHILGHLHNFPLQRIYYQHYNLQTYLVQMLMSHHMLHLKDSLYVFQVGTVSLVILHKAHAIELLFTNPTLLDKAYFYDDIRKVIGFGLLTSSVEKWKPRRKALEYVFHFDILKKFLNIMNNQAQVLIEILKDFTDKDWIDIDKFTTPCSFDIICETIFGFNPNVQRSKVCKFMEIMNSVTENITHRFVNPFYWSDTLYFNSKAGRQFRENYKIGYTFAKQIIKKKKDLLATKTSENDKDRCKRKSFMDILLDYHMNHSDFTEEDIENEVNIFIAAGYETIAGTLKWFLFLMGLNLNIQQNIQEELDKILTGENWQIKHADLNEMKYLERAIKETLRLYPAATVVGRKASEDINFCGYMLPKGTTIVPFIYGLHRDPDEFPNPEVFDPDRFLPENMKKRHPYAFVPFAAGPRNCIGHKFAMMEMKIVLATLLKHFSIKSIDPRDIVLPSIHITTHSSHPIRLKIMKRCAKI